MGRPGGTALSLLLVLVPVCLHGAWSQGASPAGQRKPFFERLRRLEEQFRRFQEVTLTHLQAVASNYNLSYSIDARFQSLAQESQALALAVNQSQATVQGDLGHLKSWIRKTQRRSRKADSRLLALGAALRERSQQLTRERKEQAAQREALASLALDMRALQDTLARLTGVVQSQGARLDALKEWHTGACPGTTAPARPGLPSQSSLELQGDRQVLGTSPEPLGPPRDFCWPSPGDTGAARPRQPVGMAP